MKLNRMFVGFMMLILSGLQASAQHPPEAAVKSADSLVTVPIGGNTWREAKDTTGGNISNDGIVNWTNHDVKFTTYIRFAAKGKLKLWVNFKAPDGISKIAITALKTTREISITGNQPKDYYAGEWNITDTGYVAFKISAVKKTGANYADINSLKLTGSAINARTAFVKNNEGEFFYWGRRGPSVHLGYTIPDKINAEWFYNEVTVLAGNDVIGSYFMADGFAEGYFGMQVNSATERHILFSVWSPYKTDNPGQIPDDQKIIMLKKGPNVHTGEFGSEGSGGQSYLNYNWKAGNTYKFLIHAKPDSANHTVYTAYFFAPEVNQWQLIASFSRPKTNTYLKHLHSFLENFEPEQGTITRQVSFNNEWITDENGKWVELNKARFTVDNTGAIGYRMDYAGGVAGNSFYLKNCGFFNNYIIRNTFFERQLRGEMPDVELGKLP
jgi:hypothetical protein